MKNADKGLIGIVAAIAVIAIAAITAVLLQPEAEYRTDDSPEATAHNYLLALRQQEYDRAHECLSSRLPEYPRNGRVLANDLEKTYSFRIDEDEALSVQPAAISGSTAQVEVLRTTFSSDGMFGSGQANSRFEMKLRKEEGHWKLVDSDRYWSDCWNGNTTMWYCK
jgi:hypothetical protein